MPFVSEDASALVAAFRGMTCGIVFGVASPLAAHPLDTIKTAMQADPHFKGNAWGTLRDLYHTGGIRRLYAGLLPPLLGSSVYRSLQFTGYSGTYAKLKDSSWATTPIPYTGGLQPRVLVGGLVGSLLRVLVETPLETWKVRRQLRVNVLDSAAGGGSVGVGGVLRQLPSLYVGFGMCFLRMYLALGSFFVIVDSAERQPALQDLFAIPALGPFLKGGVAASLGWVLAWPFELVKNQQQAGSLAGGKASALARIRRIVAERGVVGLYRGIGPGMARSMLGNGTALAAMSACQAALQHT